MAKNSLNATIDLLFKKGRWPEARALLEKEREKQPNDHWVLTQLGVAFYEERRYSEALQLFLASQKIVPDCPLTLWNLAGALDALGNPAEAIRVYAWLLECKQTATADPCWESKEWTEALKADCVYRLAACFQQMGRAGAAAHCYRQYINLLISGIQGLYSSNDAMRQIQKLQAAGPPNGSRRALKEAVHATLAASGRSVRKKNRPTVLEFDEAKLLPRRRVATTK